MVRVCKRIYATSNYLIMYRHQHSQNLLWLFGAYKGCFRICRNIAVIHAVAYLDVDIPVSYTHLTLPTKRIV